MKAAHAGMNVSEAEFNALAEDTVKALDKFKVPETEKNEVMGLLGSLKGDVINH
jgi:hemoglobin